ncbi:MAG: ATP-binding cassette domain-containing protein, partial [Flavobacteriaceae bacterium]
LIGGLLVLNQEMNIGQFVAAEIIILLVISSVEKLITGLETFYDLLTSLEKLGQVVDKELEPQDGEMPFNGNKNFEVELNNVSYSVPGRDQKIIDGVSLKINPKALILLNGTAGSGKSTLLRLITGIIEPDKGNIFVNNVSLKSIHLNHYRSHLGQSLAEESPFEGSILENITFGDKNITEEQVYWALENTGLTQFVKEQPHGLKTMLYPEGRQIPYIISKKIVLARGIVSNPKLLVLKDPLDQFDPEEANRIMDFLTDPSNPWALIVVSHNPNWEKRCSQIITMENGKIVNQKK